MASSYQAARWAHYRRAALAPKGGAVAAPSPLLTDLVEYWDLDEASGTRVGSHAGLDLTDNNTVTQADGVGTGQTAANFVTANSEFLSRASEAALQTGDIDFTFAGWFWFDDVSRGMFTKGDPTVAGGEYALLRTGAARTCNFRARSVANTGHTSITSTDTIPDLGWAFVEAFHDKAGDVIGLRLNNGTAVTGAHSGGVYAAGSSPLHLGAYAGSLFLDGRIQALGMWKRRLTSDEATWLYNNGTAARLYADVEAYTG